MILWNTEDLGYLTVQACGGAGQRRAESRRDKVQSGHASARWRSRETTSCSANRLSSPRRTSTNLIFEPMNALFGRNSRNKSRFTLKLALQVSTGLLLVANVALAATSPLKPVHLRCEYLVEPLAIDEIEPRLTWALQARTPERGQAQSAYQILVASKSAYLEKNAGDLWDTGQVPTNQTVNVVYRGKPLGSRQRCYWKVRVWDQDGRPSAWSDSSSWSMGLLKPTDWSAQYISFKDTNGISKDAGKLVLPPARQYRKEFATDKKVKRATLYATALGIYEMHINGKRIADAYFTPGWTDYRQRAYYNTTMSPIC